MVSDGPHGLRKQNLEADNLGVNNSIKAICFPTGVALASSFDTELVEEFFWGFVREAGCSLHIRELSGKNTHHIIEGAFKSVARTMKEAVAIEEAYKDEIPSTKGVL